MTFSDQVRWSRKWGAVLLLLSGVVVVALLVLRENGARDEVLKWGDLVTLPIGMGIVFLVFGGLLRPLQKKMYHSFFEPNETYRRRLGVNPVMRWLLWLDTEGRNRNA